MATLLCNQYPSFEILNPETGDWIRFRGGKLEIDDDDANYGFVMAEAQRNPAIAVFVNASTCSHCGEVFTSKAKLEGHVEAAHFDKFLEAKDAADAETRIALVKARSGVYCDIGHALMEFPTAEDLSLHTQAFHASAPADADEDEGPVRKGRGSKKKDEAEAEPVEA